MNSSTPTTPYRSIDPTFDACELAKAAGASYVSRSVVASPLHMDKMMKGALQHDGFALVEVMSNCHINWGRKNEYAAAADLIKHLKDNCTTSEEEATRDGKHQIGILHHDKEKLEYSKSYHAMAEGVRTKLAEKSGAA